MTQRANSVSGVPSYMSALEYLAISAFDVWVDGETFTYAYLNKSMIDRTGIPPENQLGKTPDECFDGEMAAKLNARYRECASARQAITYEYDSVFPTGVVHWQTTLSPVIDEGSGKVAALIGVTLDMTERWKAEIAGKETLARLSIAIGALDGGFWHYDIASKTFQTSVELSKLIGGTSARLYDLEQYMSAIIEADRDSADFSPIIEHGLERHVTQYRVRTHDNRIRWIRCERRLVRDEGGHPVSLIGAALDVTDQTLARELLEQQAATDPLTGFINRRGYQLIAHAIDTRSPKDRSRIGIMMLDLDAFKPINDAHGHAVGDQVLKLVAERIGGQIRPGDTLARIGGDEFVILIEGADLAIMGAVCARICDAVSEPMMIDGTSLQVEVSAGATMLMASDQTIAIAQIRADLAMYRAKTDRCKWVIAA